jgi:hypothetical protein
MSSSICWRTPVSPASNSSAKIVPSSTSVLLWERRHFTNYQLNPLYIVFLHCHYRLRQGHSWLIQSECAFGARRVCVATTFTSSINSMFSICLLACHILDSCGVLLQPPISVVIRFPKAWSTGTLSLLGTTTPSCLNLP